MDALFEQLSLTHHIREFAVGCKKPCNYHKYKIIGDKAPISLNKKDFLTFSLLTIDDNIYVETEALL